MADTNKQEAKYVFYSFSLRIPVSFKFTFWVFVEDQYFERIFKNLSN